MNERWWRWNTITTGNVLRYCDFVNIQFNCKVNVPYNLSNVLLLDTQLTKLAVQRCEILCQHFSIAFRIYFLHVWSIPRRYFAKTYNNPISIRIDERAEKMIDKFMKSFWWSKSETLSWWCTVYLENFIIAIILCDKESVYDYRNGTKNNGNDDVGTRSTQFQIRK